MTTAIPKTIVRQAAKWAALLDVDPSAHESCESWCNQDPRHRMVFDRMRRLDASFQSLDDVQRQALRNTAASPAKSRRKAYGSVFGFTVVAAVITLLSMHFGEDESTSIPYAALSERRNLVLPDTSMITLGEHSSLRTRFRQSERVIELTAGRLLANVATDRTRPFIVSTLNATATALGTSYAVSINGDVTQVTVVESQVRVCVRQTSKCTDLSAGESVDITGAALGAVRTVDAEAVTAWTRGWVEANDLPIADVLHELELHLDQPLHFDSRALRDVRVTGSYSVDRPRASLEALVETAGLQIKILPHGGLRVTLP